LIPRVDFIPRLHLTFNWRHRKAAALSWPQPWLCQLGWRILCLDVKKDFLYPEPCMDGH
jgi:hypothetical protein